MSLDYFAPAFIVKVNDQSLAADISRYITDLSVTHEPDTMDHFGLTLANPYPELPWTHTDKAQLFREGGKIDIQMGYVDDLQKMFSGVITSIRPTFPESGSSTVQIEGYTEMRRLRGSTKTRTFQDVTDKEIAQKIASEVQLTLDADETPTKHPYVIQYNQTDQVFLVERARRIGFQVRVEEKTLYFKAGNAQTTVYTLLWGHPSEPIDRSRRVMPLRSFSPSMNTLNQVTKVIVRGQHPTTREAFTGEATSADAGTTSSEQSGADVMEQAFGPRIEEISNVPLNSQEEADLLAKAIFKYRTSNFVTGSGVTIGLPDLRAGQLVELEGLGPRFSGRYYITQTIHGINSGGYQTTFSVNKDGLG